MSLFMQVEIARYLLFSEVAIVLFIYWVLLLYVWKLPFIQVT